MAVSAKPSDGTSTPAPSEQTPERDFRTLSDEPVRELYTPPDLPAGIGAPRGPDRAARRVPVHARHPPVDVPRAAVDDAPVRRLRHERGDQRALPLPARARPDGAVDRVRHALADGPRLRPRALARRGGPRGRRGRHARRHADAVLRHRPGRGVGVDDDQRARRDHARVLRGRRRNGPVGDPIAARAPVGHDPGGHPQGVHRAEGVVLPDRPRDAPVRRHDRVVHAAHAPLAPDLDLRLPHPRGRLDRPAGARVHAQGRPHLRRAGDRSAACTSTSSRRACRSSSTPRSTSSRRSPSTAPRGASGRGRCDETFGAADPRSWQMRFHAQTAGVSLTAQQPLNNIVRTTVEALAAVLGGTQSLHTNSYDEALALPTEEAVTIALRTQQMIAHETGVTNTVDPLGGSYFVEALTDADGTACVRIFQEDRRVGWDGRRGQAELSAARDRRRRLCAAARDRRGRADRRRRQQLPRSRRGADPHAARRPGARAQADRPPAGGAGERATARLSSARLRACRRMPPIRIET